MKASGLERELTTPTSNTLDSADPGSHARLSRYQRFYWLLIPALAALAYITVLRVGFIQDDFVILYQVSVRGADPQTLLPAPHYYLYRPLGLWFVWVLGWQLWGYNPLPFHIQGLLIHALSSLVLALWLFETTRKRLLGWLAGALFAVFPLHLEAVGWISAQWDSMALLFGLLSLWAFTVWWKRKLSWQLYLLAVLSYGLAIFTKESLLAFLPLLPLAAWLSTPPGLRKWGRLPFALIPFCALLALNVGMRFYVWGNIGGYADFSSDPTNYGAIFWDGFISHIHVMLSPINTTILGSGTGQVVGALSTIGILVGLIWHGRGEVRLLALSGAWIILGILPVVDLDVGTNDLYSNRFLYVASAGYCIGVAALLYETLKAAGKWRVPVTSLVGLVLLLCIAACWVQLRPWLDVTQQTNGINQLLVNMIPPPSKPLHTTTVLYPEDADWYVQGLPVTFEGAPFFGLGLREMYYFSTGVMTKVQKVPDATQVDLTKAGHDAFAIRFHSDTTSGVLEVDYAAGLTSTGSDSGPMLGDIPTLNATPATAFSWDFRDCTENTLGGWQAVNSKIDCVVHTGLEMVPSTADPQMVRSPLVLQRDVAPGSLVRLRTALRYPAIGPTDSYLIQWFWGIHQHWNAAQSRTLQIKSDQDTHVYWLFLADTGEKALFDGLRFDPINAQQPVEIPWIDIDRIEPAQ